MKLSTYDGGNQAFIDDDGTEYDARAGLRALRERMGWSRRDLAKQCGCSHRTVEGWEQGKPVQKAYLKIIEMLLKEIGG